MYAKFNVCRNGIEGVVQGCASDTRPVSRSGISGFSAQARPRRSFMYSTERHVYHSDPGPTEKVWEWRTCIKETYLPVHPYSRLCFPSLESLHILSHRDPSSQVPIVYPILSQPLGFPRPAELHPSSLLSSSSTSAVALLLLARTISSLRWVDYLCPRTGLRREEEK